MKMEGKRLDDDRELLLVHRMELPILSLRMRPNELTKAKKVGNKGKKLEETRVLHLGIFVFSHFALK